MHDKRILTPDEISFILPFYNEEAFIYHTLESIALQSQPVDNIILIDNASTDNSLIQISKFQKKYPSSKVTLVSEDRKGKINALNQAMTILETEYTCLGDSDTVYPPNYIAKMMEMFRNGGSEIVATMALPIFGEPDSLENKAFLKSRVEAATAHPSKCFTGGFGQNFRSQVLFDAGGFSYEQWPFCLMDHEIMNRVLKLGKSSYDVDFWCLPSPRREGQRDNVRWTLLERMVYKYSPAFLNDWVFYKFLWSRFEKRGLNQINLRTKDWGESI